ncbi:hypothetical protein CANARDRAFT_9788 [[Candida] arabinofermentans NRRL YB-2248]|uniref:Thioredoxin domain-containing protein n=1 Tax=[Candida] arabinofermentans NRRL YB-2248 TaxID=983967 RepID=A0A1E4SUV7_9ASCO|nr:hypothetical protein CANARDRAFT_9788 [[Candida] arabinofermentans NRRL YB-2248]
MLSSFKRQFVFKQPLRVVPTTRHLSNTLLRLNQQPQPTKPTKPKLSRKPLSRLPLGDEDYSKRSMRESPIEFITWKGIVIFVIIGCGLTWVFTNEKKKLALRKEADKNRGIGKPLIGGPFNLIDTNGDSFTNDELKGKFSIIYFGFSNCPDICPDELDKLGLILDGLKTKFNINLQPIFITCDPARDSPAVLKEYLSDFHSDIIGLTGDYDEIKKCCKNYRVYFSTPRDIKKGQDYLVDHSIFFYLMDLDGEFIDVLGRQYEVDDAIEKIKSHIDAYQPKEVLFKRKPVEFLPPPILPNDFDFNSQVWFINETGEWFIDYEEYLKRMHYYQIKKFVCETSGNSNFTFFEALKVELTELQMMELKFPEPVKEPILRYVSFSLTPRIDSLVDEVYSKFKDDFFPGDQVVAKIDGEKFKGIIREKARFNAISLPDGSVRAGYCSYRVLLEDNREITINSSENLSRERNSFTKWYVKTFLKMSLTRSNKAGAPWVIKKEMAQKCRISLDYPPHLKHFENDDEFDSKKSKSKKKKKKISPGSKIIFDNTSNGSNGSNNNNNDHIFDSLKETPPTASEQDAGQSLQEWKDKWYETLKHTTVYFEKINNEEIDIQNRSKISQLFKFAGVEILNDFDPMKVNFIISTRPYSVKTIYSNDDIFSFVSSKKMKVWHYEKSFRFFKSLNITIRKIQNAQRDKLLKEQAEEYLKNNPSLSMSNPIPLPISNSTSKTLNGFVDILPANNNGNPNVMKLQMATPNDSRSSTPTNKLLLHHGGALKPKLNPSYPIEDLKVPFQAVSKLKPRLNKIKEFSDTSDLLEIWIFFNMYSRALIIDNFTFDDFETALKWDDETTLCPLLMEIYCCMFKAYMDNKGTLLVTLPERPEEPDEDDEEEEEDREEDDEDEDVDKQYNGKTEDPIKIKSQSSEPEPELISDTSMDVDEEINHNAYSIIESKKTNWKDKLIKRQFKNGGFVVILLGILSSVEFIPDYRKDIIKIYESIAPGDFAPTAESITTNFYKNMTADLRCKSLAIIMNLLLNGSIIRSYMDKCLEDSTSLRRERLEIIKELRQALEDGTNYQKEVLDALKLIDTTAIKERLDQEEEEERLKSEPKSSSSFTTTTLTKSELEQKKKGGRPVQNSIPVEPTNLEKAVCQAHPEFLKMIKIRSEKLKIIDELKLKKKELEKNLNEIDVQRVRYIGRDRLYNRYWWFEKNGLPNLSIGKNQNDEDDEDDDLDDDDSEYVEDTYLMGRLWIQGPGEEDRKLFLKLNDEKLNEWKKIITIDDDIIKDEDEDVDVDVDDKKSISEIPNSFLKAAKEVFNLSFENGQVKDINGLTIVDEFGSAAERDYSPMERKLLEEGSNTLLSLKDWGYIEDPKEFENLINWLNPDGDRERLLKKELVDLHEQIKNSLSSRVKSLGIGQPSDDQLKYEKIIAETIISDEESEDTEDIKGENDIVEIEDNDDDESSLSSSSEEEEEEEKPRTRRAIAEEFDKKRKREEKLERKLAKRAKLEIKPAQRIAKREALKRKQKEREEKLQRLRQAKIALANLEFNKDRENLINWVNSSAIETIGYSHYEGPKPVVKKKIVKKSRR